MFIVTVAAAPMLVAAGIAPAAPMTSITVSAPAQTAETKPRDTAQFRLRARVPMTCTARLQSMPTDLPNGDTYQLGTFRELCNSPRGYALVVSYPPGTLQGAELSAGEDRVLLDGTGRAVLSQVNGPKVRERDLTITAGLTGLDSTSVSINMVPF